MMVNARGLQYLRMSEGFDTSTNRPIDWGTLWAIHRNWMKDPVQQLKDYIASGSEGSAAADVDQ